MDREFGSLEGRDFLSTPGNEDELVALALVVARNDLQVAELHLTIIKLGNEFWEASLSSSRDNELVSIIVQGHPTTTQKRKRE